MTAMIARLSAIGITGMILTVGAWVESAQACSAHMTNATVKLKLDNIGPTSHPLNILLYENPESTDAKKVISPVLEQLLAKIGHHPIRVQSSEVLGRLLSAGQWTCEEHLDHPIHAVVADLETAERLTSNESRPHVIPILSSPKQYTRERRGKYPVILVPSSQPTSHLPAIEKVGKLLTERGARPSSKPSTKSKPAR